ncbi:MAG: hypothetical protein OXN25_18305 [Candidatus Poribacteria bacterium]|nr:hypothetical protein [Candidatus Poribacteria bacterium]MYK20559.1 hypothetical protein [Candidatus Poribacteria bacterium]
MENATLEDIVQRLDRLEKMIGHVNEQLSWIVEALVPDAPKNCETAPINATNVQKDEQDDNLGAKAIEKILEGMGYPPDFKPRPLKEVRKSIVESGIRPEDNEFSKAIIAEREK